MNYNETFDHLRHLLDFLALRFRCFYKAHSASWVAGLRRPGFVGRRCQRLSLAVTTKGWCARYVDDCWCWRSSDRCFGLENFATVLVWWVSGARWNNCHVNVGKTPGRICGPTRKSSLRCGEHVQDVISTTQLGLERPKEAVIVQG